MRPVNEESTYHASPTNTELSQRTDEKKHKLRLPDRIGTWQFMSINSLDKPTKPIGLPEELESFFHLLLYCAIRHLPHNCPGDVIYYVNQYFDEGVNVGEDSSRHTCGFLKASVIQQGTLVAHDRSDLVFLRQPVAAPKTPRTASPTAIISYPAPEFSENEVHPIQRVLIQLLELFHALYTCQKAAQFDPEIKDSDRGRRTPANLAPAGSSEGSYSAQTRRLLARYQAREMSPDCSGENDDRERRKALADKAKKLASHDEVGRILWSALYSDGARWPEEDKQEDQLNPKYRGSRSGEEQDGV